MQIYRFANLHDILECVHDLPCERSTVFDSVYCCVCCSNRVNYEHRQVPNKQALDVLFVFASLNAIPVTKCMCDGRMAHIPITIDEVTLIHAIF